MAKRDYAASREHLCQSHRDNSRRNRDRREVGIRNRREFFFVPRTQSSNFHSPAEPLFDKALDFVLSMHLYGEPKEILASRLSSGQKTCGVSMLTRRILCVVLVCSVVCICSTALFSQANGSFSGTITDKTGSVIAGATVKITSQQTGVSREAKTDDSGHFVVPLLPVSVYSIRAEAQGFQATEEKDLKLQVNEEREVNFTLAPASVTEQVEVSAAQVAVETTNPTLGQVITEQQVAQLPLNGRDFVQLATLAPGTTTETAPSFFNQGTDSEASARGSYSLSVGGSRPQSTDWLLDDVDNNELTAGGIGILPSIDAIQEFKVLTYNYSAEYGTRAGPTVLVSTKSGANQ